MCKSKERGSRTRKKEREQPRVSPLEKRRQPRESCAWRRKQKGESKVLLPLKDMISVCESKEK